MDNASSKKFVFFFLQQDSLCKILHNLITLLLKKKIIVIFYGPLRVESSLIHVNILASFVFILELIFSSLLNHIGVLKTSNDFSMVYKSSMNVKLCTPNK